MIDASLWRERAAIHISVTIDQARDRGVPVRAVEQIVRAAGCPFGAVSSGAGRVWVETIETVFPPPRLGRRRKRPMM